MQPPAGAYGHPPPPHGQPMMPNGAPAPPLGSSDLARGVVWSTVDVRFPAGAASRGPGAERRSRRDRPARATPTGLPTRSRSSEVPA